MRKNTNQQKKITTFYETMVVGFSLKIPDDDWSIGRYSFEIYSRYLQKKNTTISATDWRKIIGSIVDSA